MKKKLKFIVKTVKSIKINHRLKPCPFCGDRNLVGWIHVADFKNPECVAYKSRGRYMSIGCRNCGILVEFGYFGGGIKDKTMVEMVARQWNGRKG